MALCNDKRVTYLRDLGYNVVALPREGVKPLTVAFAEDGSRLRELGYLPEIWESNADEPEPKEGDNVAEIGSKSTNSIDAKVGIDILSKLASALGFNGGKVTGNYNSAKTFQFHFKDVERVRVTPFELGNYLKEGKLETNNAFVRKYFTPEEKIYVVTEVLVSSAFGVSAESSSEGAIDIEASALEGLADVELGIEAKKTGESGVLYSGKDRLPFAFVAAQLSHDGVQWVVEDFPQPGSVHLGTPKGAVLFGKPGTIAFEAPNEPEPAQPE